jgi:hypothetical protein
MHKKMETFVIMNQDQRKLLYGGGFNIQNIFTVIVLWTFMDAQSTV